jgi:hypothetical protein
VLIRVRCNFHCRVSDWRAEFKFGVKAHMGEPTLGCIHRDDVSENEISRAPGISVLFKVDSGAV